MLGKIEITDISGRDPARVADKALKAAAGFWYVVAIIGMWIFANIL